VNLAFLVTVLPPKGSAVELVFDALLRTFLAHDG